MYIGDVLIAQGLATPEIIDAAITLQRQTQLELAECLARVSGQNSQVFDAVIKAAPMAPRGMNDTGLGVADMLSLVVKTIFVAGDATPLSLQQQLKLPPRAIDQLIREADDRRLLDLRGPSAPDCPSDLRYALSEKGIQWANEAMARNQYVGPAPVTLDAYRERILKQRIVSEHVTRAMIDEAFADLVVSERLLRQIGPAVNSGKSALFYGPAGDGKTSLGERIGAIFKDIIYIPHCFEVDGQIVKVFDPSVHKAIPTQFAGDGSAGGVRREDVDLRWVACRRPFIVTGGELTLEMLDLSFNAIAKFYEAPAHIKALGGVCLIDDFGRQLVSPTALLNRWIVPMESRIEYLKLHTGKSFAIPFDELVLFSTNLSPSKLMDPAFLRRIPYKILVNAPTPEEYHRVFKGLEKKTGMEIGPRLVDAIIVEVRDRLGMPLANYQPKFIVDQIIAASRFEGIAPRMRPELVAMAINNLMARENQGQDWPYAVAQSGQPSADVVDMPRAVGLG